MRKVIKHMLSKISYGNVWVNKTWFLSGGYMYYNYHAQIKKLISEGHLVKSEIVDQWNSISPALVLYFDNHKPMPVREYRWDEYLQFTRR